MTDFECLFCGFQSHECVCDLTRKEINKILVKQCGLCDLDITICDCYFTNEYKEKKRNELIKKEIDNTEQKIFKYCIKCLDESIYCLCDEKYWMDKNEYIIYLQNKVKQYKLPTPKIKIVKISEKECGILPTRGTKKSAGWDIYTPILFELKSKSEIVIDTLICWEIPDGYYGDIRTKSGLRFNKKIINYHGVIDSDFRNTLKILIENKTDNNYMFDVGDKICQMIITPYLTTDLELVDELNIPEQEHKGFGSTGK